MVIALLSGLVILFITCCVRVTLTRDYRSETTMTIQKNGEDYRLTTWEEGGWVFTKRGWDRSVNRGDGWQIIEEGKGHCPYKSLTGEGWAQD